MSNKSQSSNSILMIEPNHFELNLQAVADNYFMNKPKEELNVHESAVKEFQTYLHDLEGHGVQVKLFQPRDGIQTPDCLFPNNWFSTHAGWEVASGRNTLVLYPMCHPNRRLERRANIIEFLKSRVEDLDVVDLSHYENEDKYLEGTGSFVLDRVNRVAYLCVSQRSHKELAEEWAKRLGYKLVLFTSVDSQDKIVYHTNVVMAMCSSLAIICMDSVKDPKEAENLLAHLKTHHEVLTITHEQVNRFCGNVIEVKGKDNEKHLVCSKSSFDAFTESDHKVLSKHFKSLITQDIPTIQSVGGGGIRCMIAELF